MLSTPWITCLWPGLSELWVRGRWTGLVWALGFTLLLNAALVSKGVWPELGNVWIRSGLWYLALGFWLTNSVWMGIRIASGSLDAIDTSIDQLYQSAQTAYLKGQWYQAEAVLLRLLRREPGDAEALLMLATLKRHTKQYDEAREALDKLERLDASRRWWFEIHREKQLLTEREEAETEAQATSSKTKADNLGEQNAERGGPSLPEAA
ncbi:tetratricopeptide repeat protein [Bremerella sp. JC817]|uniref:tetratricopeptide repeat protein n=1 Tax=Bremerella sp. JC817 TaxID=3231756 RepID=UPI003459FFA3